MTVVQPDPSITVPGVIEAIAEPSVLRMAKLASYLQNLAITITVFAAIGAAVGAAEGNLNGATQVLVCLLSVIPFWIVYGFAWAFADFRVTAN